MPKPGGVAVMLDLGKPKREGMDMEMSDESGKSEAEKEALSDFFSAGKRGDMDAAHEALKTYMSICYPSLDSGYEEGDASEKV